MSVYLEMGVLFRETGCVETLCDPAIFCMLLILKLWMNTVFLNMCLQIILLRYIFNMSPSELGDRRTLSKCALVKSRKRYKFSLLCCDYGERR